MLKGLSRLVGPAESTGIDERVVPGILAGMVAAVPMALTGALITVVQDHGPFGPIQRIAYVVVDSQTVTTAEARWAADPYFVDGNFLVFGGVTHLAMGAVFGALFALLVGRLQSRQRVLVAGPVYALVVMAVMGLVVLPIVAALLGAGDQVVGIPGEIGYASFVAQHLVYGWYLGRWRWPELEVEPELEPAL